MVYALIRNGADYRHSVVGVFVSKNDAQQSVINFHKNCQVTIRHGHEHDDIELVCTSQLDDGSLIVEMEYVIQTCELHNNPIN